MALYELGEDHMVTIKPTSFASANIKEREDLQRLLRERIEVIVPDGMVLAEEFSNWEESNRRIDLLVLDRDANLVVVELKRTEDGGHMELQALRYAAMVSTMTFGQAVEAHRVYLEQRSIDGDPQERILTFLNWDEVKEDTFAQDVRIVLASANFSKELTTTVLWLNNRSIDIRCVRMVPHEYCDKIILDVQDIIPLPEAIEYQERVREKATQERVDRIIQEKQGRKYKQFWAELLPKAKIELPMFNNVEPTHWDWLPAKFHGLNYAFVPRSTVPSRVELYINRSNKQMNKAIYEDLKGHKDEIESIFGDSLIWDDMGESNPCRISKNVESGTFRDESSWKRLQDDLIDTMKRLEESLRPFVQKYLDGGTPNLDNQTVVLENE